MKPPPRESALCPAPSPDVLWKNRIDFEVLNFNSFFLIAENSEPFLEDLFPRDGKVRSYLGYQALGKDPERQSPSIPSHQGQERASTLSSFDVARPHR